MADEGKQENVTPVAPESPHELEKKEEEKLHQRYPTQLIRPMAGHSAFLQKRLARGQKYFDSGDYQMAKQTGKQGKPPRTMPPILSNVPSEIPTTDAVPSRRTSLVQPSKLANNS